MEPVELGERMRIIRERCGATQLEVAAQLGVTQSTVAHWEAGRNEPNFLAIVKIAEYLKVNIAEFVIVPKTIRTKKPGRPPKK